MWFGGFSDNVCVLIGWKDQDDEIYILTASGVLFV